MVSYQKEIFIVKQKKAGLKSVDLLKHPSKKVLMRNGSVSRKINTDKFNKATFEIEHF